MKRAKSGALVPLSPPTQRTNSLLYVFVALCIILGILEVSYTFKNGLYSSSNGFSMLKKNLEETKIIGLAKIQVSGLNLTAIVALGPVNATLKAANDAVELGRKMWRELELSERNRSEMGISSVDRNESDKVENEECPDSITISGYEFSKNGRVAFLPCGLTLGSHITVVGKPRAAHVDSSSKISVLKEGKPVMVSQFMVELQGLKTVEGEEPPRILHFNPWLKGDMHGKPAIVLNTSYRMPWGISQRCQGLRSRADEETVDGFVKCEKWIKDDDDDGSVEPKASRWLNWLLGRTKKGGIDKPFPFSEEKLFVLTLNAGLEGFHVNVDGRHVTSFAYGTKFTIEEATGLVLDGDVDVLSVAAASLPKSQPSSVPQRHLDLSDRWKASPIPEGHIELFVGIISAANHFTERMAARKTWMQHDLIKSSTVVTRFFVALHKRKEINEEVKKEAEFFGDIVFVPYMDAYHLVAIKTTAICEYGVRTLSARYIMKGDDDTFVRVDAIINEVRKVRAHRSLYIGNINLLPMTLYSGKWAVSHEEWPGKFYPPYAHGPGYIISSDIANSIVSDFDKLKLMLYKLEDVSMGISVQKFNKSKQVEYVHSLKFCALGCIEDYITAHYQSPRQMICLWNKLKQWGRPVCCDV